LSNHQLGQLLETRNLTSGKTHCNSYRPKTSTERQDRRPVSVTERLGWYPRGHSRPTKNSWRHSLELWISGPVGNKKSGQVTRLPVRAVGRPRESLRSTHFGARRVSLSLLLSPVWDFLCRFALLGRLCGTLHRRKPRGDLWELLLHPLLGHCGGLCKDLLCVFVGSLEVQRVSAHRSGID
jgi:hypothetical protein